MHRGHRGPRLHGVAIQLLAQPRCERTRRIGPRADSVSSGNDKRPWPQAGIIDHMISKVDEIRRAPQLNHHIAGTEYTRRNGLGTRVARSHQDRCPCPRAPSPQPHAATLADLIGKLAEAPRPAAELPMTIASGRQLKRSESAMSAVVRSSR